MKRVMILLVSVAVVLVAASPVLAQDNPCNPCGGKAKNPCNPCGGKGEMHAVNPCHAKMGTVFHVDDPMNRNTVSFESEAPLEDIIGISNQLSGYIVFDPENPKKGGKGWLSVTVASLDTGIPLRDEHLQSPDWLNAGEFPSIEFAIENVRDIKKTKSGDGFTSYDMTVVGPFTLNGKTHEVQVPARVTYLPQSEKTQQKMPGNLLAVRGTFEVSLKDYGIKGFAGVVGSKVSETITVSVSLTASDDAPEMAGNPCNPCNPCGGKAKNPCNPCGGKAKNPCGEKKGGW